MTDQEAVERALAVLKSDAELPAEPNVLQFVAWSRGPCSDQITMTVSRESFLRALHARIRIFQRRIERIRRRTSRTLPPTP